MGRKETEEAIADSRAGRVTRVGSVDELLAELKTDDDNATRRLHEKAGPAYDVLKADPARAVTPDQVRNTLAELNAADERDRQADIAQAIELARRVDAGLEPLTPFDPAEYLTSAEAVVAFLTDAKATADPAYIEHAQALAARARAMHGIE